MNSEHLLKWDRLSFDRQAVYIDPEAPDWIIPNAAGDRLLSKIQKTCSVPKGLSDFVTTLNGTKNIGLIKARQFLCLLPEARANHYPGRSQVLSLTRLRECWIHITEACNLRCGHCLFAAPEKSPKTLSFEDIAGIVREAFDLGTRTFYLTGGEPLTHPRFDDICRMILNKSSDTHLMVLTNGLLLYRHRALIDRSCLGRLHLQISIDGIQPSHDYYRGPGAFQQLMDALCFATSRKIHSTLAMAVTAQNVRQMPDIVRIAAEHGVAEVHYLWLFATGNATPEMMPSPDTVFEELRKAEHLARQEGVCIDNIRQMESQIFSVPGTRYDLGGAGWESMAVGPEGFVYPTPALVGRKTVRCGHIRDTLSDVWQTSPELSRIRALSISDDPSHEKNPLRYLVGGGDLDHSVYAGGYYVGHDPYVSLYNQIALWLMTRSGNGTSGAQNTDPFPRILFKMGDRILQCDHHPSGVALTHSNCVLTLSSSRQKVGQFYHEAAVDPNTDIQNPVCYPESEISHIPQSARIRSYGCGSPVLDADLKPGEIIVDLGCGAGMECFIAARQVGKTGRVYGIDMLDPMLSLAEKSVDAVTGHLGYANVEFRKGFLENLPLENESANVVISNCVINLSEDKRKTVSEVFRILQPGGRIMISDVVTDVMPPPDILNDERLRGECIAGAMCQPYLAAMLESIGFIDIEFIKRFFYREINGHRFYSLTYTAFKPEEEKEDVAVIYPGPFAAVVTDSGELLVRGQNGMLNAKTADRCGDRIFILDDLGNAANVHAQNTCACFTSPAGSLGSEAKKDLPNPSYDQRFLSECMVCGHPLRYLDNNIVESCAYCGAAKLANAVCENGHFVCDECHSRDALEMIRHICLTSQVTDMVELLNTIRTHPAMPLHGPEHHFAVPGVILSTYRNLGGDVADADILSAIERGQAIPGGVCAFWGACGAALGVGVAFALILKSNPLKPDERRMLQEITETVSRFVSTVTSGRCCQRESWTALKTASDISRKLLPIPLTAKGATVCSQQSKNKECLGKTCPYFR